jgi:hypothetical protein
MNIGIFYAKNALEDFPGNSFLHYAKGITNDIIN